MPIDKPSESHLSPQAEAIVKKITTEHEDPLSAAAEQATVILAEAAHSNDKAAAALCKEVWRHLRKTLQRD